MARRCPCTSARFRFPDRSKRSTRAEAGTDRSPFFSPSGQPVLARLHHFRGDNKAFFSTPSCTALITTNPGQGALSLLSNAVFSRIVPPPTGRVSLFATAHGVLSSIQCCPAISRRLARDAARYRLPRRPRPRLYPRMTPPRSYRGNKNHLYRAL
jgi:hypothetical protein